MGYRKRATLCTVQIVPLRRLSPAQTTLCDTLRREAGRCWTDLLAAHIAGRETNAWLDAGDLESLTKGGQYQLHSQSVQALAQKLIANVDTARELRAQEKATGGEVQTKYPYHAKPYQTVTWKAQTLRVRDARLHLFNGRHQAPLVLPLPARFQTALIRTAELTWRADHYELALTVDSGEPAPPLQPSGQIAGVDLGEINIAAVVTEAGKGIVVSGRRLRWCKQLRNKRHAALTSLLARCKPGSRRSQRLRRRKAQAAAKLYRQQREILHQASRQIVNFAAREGVHRLAVGDVRDIGDGVDLGAHANQKISQWPHGQFINYVKYKARKLGIAVEQIPEDYSTRTCSACKEVRSSAPRGRVFRCPGCGATLHRDGNGAANIASRARCGKYGSVQLSEIMHLRPIVVRAATPAPVAGSEE